MSDSERLWFEQTIADLRFELKQALDQKGLLAVKVSQLKAVTLTEHDRVAVEAAARIVDEYEDEMDGFRSGAAATLRKLLERLG